MMITGKVPLIETPSMILRTSMNIRGMGNRIGMFINPGTKGQE